MNFGKQAASLTLTTPKAWAAALACSAMLTSFEALAQTFPEETIIDLGAQGGEQSGAFGTSTDGSVVFGYAQRADGTIGLVQWVNGTVRDITPAGAEFGVYVFDRGGVRRVEMSRDGSTLVGLFIFTTPELSSRAYVIRNGVATLLTGSDYINPLAISNDGRVIAGVAQNEERVVAPMYYDEAGLHWLPSLNRSETEAGSRAAYVRATNADGSVIVGEDYSGSSRAVRWVNGAIENLGTLPGGDFSRAIDVSADGSVVVGDAYLGLDGGLQVPRGFIWKNGVMTDLGSLTTGGDPMEQQSQVIAVSGDGTTVIGRSRLQNSAGQTLSQGFVWRDGVMQYIGEVPTDCICGPFSTAVAVSFDGRAIAGNARSVGVAAEAFRWYDGEITLLGTLGGTESYATDISDDGSTVVGVSRNESGAWRAFIWRTVMQDYTNLVGSFAGLAEETELASSQSRERLQLVERPGCYPGSRTFCFGVSAYGWTGGAVNGAGNAGEFGIRVSAGVRPHPVVAIGVDMAWGEGDLPASRIRMSGSSAWMTSIRFGTHTGPALQAWYAESRDDIRLNRTSGLADVQPVSGHSRINGKSFGLRAGGTISLTGGWALSPTASLGRVEIDRPGFRETGGDFPAAYSDLTLEVTRVTGGLVAAGQVGPGSLSAGIEIDHDLRRSDVMLEGSSQIPGAEAFELSSELDRKNTRLQLSVGYVLPMGAADLSAGFSVRSPAYGDSWQTQVGIGLSGSF